MRVLQRWLTHHSDGKSGHPSGVGREYVILIWSYRGFLTGALKSPDDFEPGDFRTFAPRFSKENFHKNLEMVDALAKLAEKKKCTTGQLVLAFLMHQGDDIIPIPGTTKVKNFDENMAALKVNISKEDDKEIRELISKADVHGERYPAAFSKALFVDTVPLKK